MTANKEEKTVFSVGNAATLYKISTANEVNIDSWLICITIKQLCSFLYNVRLHTHTHIYKYVFKYMRPYLLESEILQTLKEMKDGKAAGCDKITVKLIKNSGTTTTKGLAQVCQQIYNEEI